VIRQNDWLDASPATVEASRQTAILEAVADGVLVTDPTNHITFVNPSG